MLVCFEQAEMLLGGGDKVVVTGAPVRGEILSADRKRRAPASACLRTISLSSRSGAPWARNI